MPSNPELRLHAGNMSVDECVQQVVKELQQHVSIQQTSVIFFMLKRTKGYTIYSFLHVHFVARQF